MRIALTLAVLLGSAPACHARPPETKPTKPTKATQASKPMKGAKVNSGFDKALEAFRKEVAAAVHKDVAVVHVIPDRAELIGFRDLATGDLIAFQADLPIEPAPSVGPTRWNVRGFASPAGEVVLTSRQNLGVLLRAAHLLDAPRSLPAMALAERLVWLWVGPPGSPQHRLVAGGGTIFVPPMGEVRVGPPAIERRPDGSAHLVFLYDSIGNTGVVTQSRAELVCGKDYVVGPFGL